MVLSARLFRLPRLRRFLHFMSLTTGASLITLSLLLNKVSGLYGIIALFTGYYLSPLQFSLYIYSILALILTSILARHIRTQSPFHCLALSCFYVLDSIINAAYTAAFAVAWFFVLTQSTTSTPGSETIDQTSGFTSPQANVSSVLVDARPAVAATAGQDAVLTGIASTSNTAALSTRLWSRESLNSIGIIVTLWTIRLYFCLIMISFARFALRQHILRSSLNSSRTSSSDQVENPFAPHLPLGQGWKGQLARCLISLSPRYWLGTEEDDVWMTQVDAKFRRSVESGNVLPYAKMSMESAAGGPNERERRRRSGTGPPAPAVELLPQVRRASMQK